MNAAAGNNARHTVPETGHSERRGPISAVSRRVSRSSLSQLCLIVKGAVIFLVANKKTPISPLVVSLTRRMTAGLWFTGEQRTAGSPSPLGPEFLQEEDSV